MSGTVLRVLVDLAAAGLVVLLLGWLAYRVLRFLWSAFEELTQ